MTPPTTNPSGTDGSAGSIVDEQKPSAWAFWNRFPRASDILSTMALMAATLIVLGWKYVPASRQVELETAARVAADSNEELARAKADRELRADVDRNAHRIDTLSIQQTLTNFLLCDARRGRQSDVRAQERCEDILSSWGKRP